MPRNQPQFGQSIRTYRETAGLSLRAFAKAVGVSHTFVSQLENGVYAPPGPAKIKRIAEILGRDADTLLAMAGRLDPEVIEIMTERVDIVRIVRLMADLDMKGLLEMRDMAKVIAERWERVGEETEETKEGGSE